MEGRELSEWRRARRQRLIAAREALESAALERSFPGLATARLAFCWPIRNLAALPNKPAVIGTSYELARMDTIHPQPWDIPVDWVVSERGVYRRDRDGLAFVGDVAQ